MTPDVISGLWAGTMSNGNDDVRVRISGNTVVAAVRCGSGHGANVATVGASISAVVTTSSMRVVESKTVGTGSCRMIVMPQTITRCGAVHEGCFTVTGTTLFTTRNSGPPNPDFTKLSD